MSASFERGLERELLYATILRWRDILESKIESRNLILVSLTWAASSAKYACVEHWRRDYLSLKEMAGRDTDVQQALQERRQMTAYFAWRASFEEGALRERAAAKAICFDFEYNAARVLSSWRAMVGWSSFSRVQHHLAVQQWSDKECVLCLYFWHAASSKRRQNSFKAHLNWSVCERRRKLEALNVWRFIAASGKEDLRASSIALLRGLSLGHEARAKVKATHHSQNTLH